MVKILYFLEDLAQERFITAVVDRVAEEEGRSDTALDNDVRNSAGGQGQVIQEFDRFLRTSPRVEPDLLVVVIDADCEGEARRRARLASLIERTEYAGRTVLGVPNPHIERWYMADPVALQLVTGSPGLAALPPIRCQRDLYKMRLREEFAKGGVTPPLGGAEYADEIVSAMDIYRASKNDTSFDTFVRDLRNYFRPA